MLLQVPIIDVEPFRLRRTVERGVDGVDAPRR